MKYTFILLILLIACNKKKEDKQDINIIKLIKEKQYAADTIWQIKHRTDFIRLNK